MSEEQRIFEGVLFAPGAQELRDIKLRAHNLDTDYNHTYEYETEKRARILKELLGAFGEGSFIQGPIAFHYGKHTRIGKRFFGNFNLTVQDDAPVTIGDDCNFGPNCTIVTPVHPMLPDERYLMYNEAGENTVSQTIKNGEKPLAPQNPVNPQNPEATFETVLRAAATSAAPAEGEESAPDSGFAPPAKPAVTLGEFDL